MIIKKTLDTIFCFCYIVSINRNIGKYRKYAAIMSNCVRNYWWWRNGPEAVPEDP
jgi:hypothetical protein